jgi:hypothetical protein
LKRGISGTGKRDMEEKRKGFKLYSLLELRADH